MHDHWMTGIACLLLVAAIFTVFGQTIGFGFVNYDDPTYVTQNPNVLGGMTPGNIKWALTTGYFNNWHPITWLSLILDAQVYGLWAGGYHLSNILLHALTAIGLFLVLRRLTSELWPSFFVAVIFAIHPLRAESVAWIAERKDVLSGVFFVATLAAYRHYAIAPFSLGRYLLALITFTLGLMAKPMLVTTPFLLLLLDFWPLRRFGQEVSADATTTKAPLRRLLLEKLPFLAIATVSCIITAVAQSTAIASLQAKPFDIRISNAIVSYVTYVVHFFYPTDLAAFYPYPALGIPAWKTLLCGSLIVLVSVIGLGLRRRAPYLLVGWFWYLGTLVPVIGLLQVGNQAMADRYTYLPQIGLAIAVVWGLHDLTRFSAAVGIRRVAAATVVLALMTAAFAQTSYWRDSETLWRHAIACTRDSALAHHLLGCALFEQQRNEEAMDQFRAALDILPHLAESRHNLATCWKRLGKTDEAIAEYRHVVRIAPEMAEAHSHLAGLLSERGHVSEAIEHYEKALAACPELLNGHFNLGVLLNQQGKAALAVQHWRQALQQTPDDVDALDQLAWTLATCREASVRNGKEALELARRAVALSHSKNPDVLGSLAAALAEMGRYNEATTVAERAMGLADQSGDSERRQTLRQQVESYRRHLPYRDPPLPAPQ